MIATTLAPVATVRAVPKPTASPVARALLARGAELLAGPRPPALLTATLAVAAAYDELCGTVRSLYLHEALSYLPRTCAGLLGDEAQAALALAIEATGGAS